MQSYDGKPWQGTPNKDLKRCEKMLREAEEEGERAWINNEDYVGLVD